MSALQISDTLNGIVILDRIVISDTALGKFRSTESIALFLFALIF